MKMSSHSGSAVGGPVTDRLVVKKFGRGSRFTPQWQHRRPFAKSAIVPHPDARSAPRPKPSNGEGEAGRSELLQQTADVVQLVLRPGAVGATPAQLLLDRLGALLLALLGDRGRLAFV